METKGKKAKKRTLNTVQLLTINGLIHTHTQL